MQDMHDYFDAYVIAPEAPYGDKITLPKGFSGALFFGPAARLCREDFAHHNPEPLWRHAEPLDRIAGATHVSFPSLQANAVDLTLEPAIRDEWLKKPAEWWPLCDALRLTGSLLRLKLPPGAQCLVHAKQILKRFSKTQFWVDPFLHGPCEGWMGHVRLGEFPNCHLTTLGLNPVEILPDTDAYPPRDRFPEDIPTWAIEARTPRELAALSDHADLTPIDMPSVAHEFESDPHMIELKLDHEIGVIPRPIKDLNPDRDMSARPSDRLGSGRRQPALWKRPTWTRESAAEALHFAVGEVGAGQILYASGLEWEALDVSLDRPFREWLEESHSLDSAELELVLRGNARLLFRAREDALGEMS